MNLRRKYGLGMAPSPRLGLGIGRSAGGGGGNLAILPNGETGVLVQNIEGTTLTLTISGGTAYDGTYGPTDISTLPVNIKAPVLSVAGGGVARPTATLNILPGLWYTSTGYAGGATYSDNSANNVDATNPAAPTLVIASGDVGTTLVVTETVGGVNANSNGILAVAGSVSFVRADTFINDTSTNTTYTSAALFPSGFTAQAGSNRVILFSISVFSNATGVPSLTVALGAATASLITSSLGTSASLQLHQYLYAIPEASIPAGANTLTVTSNVQLRALSAISTEFANVDQANLFGSPVTTSTTTSTTISATVNMSQTSSMLFSAASMVNGGVTRLPITPTNATLAKSAETGVTNFSDVTMAVGYELVSASGNRTHSYAFGGANNPGRVIAVEVRKTP